MKRIQTTFNSSSETLRFAAQELERYLEQMLVDMESPLSYHLCVEPDMTRRGLPAVPDPLTDDQYDITSNEEGGRISGTNERSVLLGVYRLLEKAGCRFLRPGREYERIPLITLEALCHSFRETASLRHRGACIEGANSLENVTDFIEWLPKIGCNSFFLQFKLPYSFLQMWYSHRFNSLLAPEPFDERRAAEMTRVMDQEVRKRGLLYHRVGHGWTSEAIGCPSHGWISQEQPLSDENSEMLALVGGKRELFGGIPTNTNLCYSREEVLNRISEDVAQYAANNPEISYLHVWLADECNNVCECSQCRETTPSDLYIRLLNRIDDALSARNLPTRIVFLLYHELLWAPEKERLNHPERFLLMFAPISRTFEKAYHDAEELPPIPEYHRNRIQTPGSLEENLAFLRKWQGVFSGDGFIYDYHLGRAHYGDLGYLAISRLLYEDITSVRRLGLNGFIACQELRSYLPNGLPDYVLAKASFDTSRSFDDIVEEYFCAAYGDNWKTVYSYLSQLSALCSPDYFNGAGPRISPELSYRYQEIQKKAREISLPSPDNNTEHPVVQRFLKHLWYHREYTLLFSSALESLACGDSRNTQAHWQEFRRLIQENERAFQKALDVYRVTEVAVKYTGFPADDGQNKN